MKIKRSLVWQQRTQSMSIFFGSGKAEGTAQMKDLLGGKGANLAEMTSIGLPVPPGFTISTELAPIIVPIKVTILKG